MLALSVARTSLQCLSSCSKFYTSRPRRTTIVQNMTSQSTVRTLLLAYKVLGGVTARRTYASTSNENPHITITDQEGKHHKLSPSLGDNLLYVAQAHGLDLEGACGGLCSCSTCHIIVMNQEFYDRIPEPKEDENDMLDEANGRTDLSRLGCQVRVTGSLDGMVVKLSNRTNHGNV